MPFSKLVNTLKSSAIVTLSWFENNHMKLNAPKCHLFECSDTEKNVSVKIGNSLTAENEVKLSGISIDKELNFNSHINSIC